MRHPIQRRSVKRLFRFPSRSEADVQQDVHDEFAFHLDMRTETLIASGLSAAAARAQALREFGNASQAARLAVSRQQRIERRNRIARALEELRQDIRLGWRSLRRTPGFTLTAILVVALGIGATTALFSVLAAVLLRPLPYPDADRLVEVWTTTGAGGATREPMALPDFRAMREGSRSFDALGTFSGSGVIITGDERAEFVQAISMTASTWRVLGVQPLIGRTFVDAEEAWGSHRVVVISEPLWRRRFGGDAGAVGSELRFGPQSLTVIGVMPGSFQMVGYDADIWMPMSFPPGSPMETRNNRFASVLGRLKSGVSVQQARDDLSAIADQLRRDYPQFNAGLGVAAGEWQEGVVGDVRPTLLLLFGAVVLVLLIACANLANLLIARATVRERELQIRAMLGADRARLIREVLTEVVLLVAAGGTAGVTVAVALIRVLTRIGPIGLPRLNEVTVDGEVMGFSIALMLLTTLLFGLWPSRHAARASVTSTVRAAARTIAGGRLRHRSRRALIVAEVSLSLVLLIGATLLIVSLRRLQYVEAGFNADRLFTTMVIRYRPDGRDAFVQQLVDRISSLPGVRAAAATNSLPLAPGGWGKYFTADDEPVPGSIAEVPTISYYHVTPRYFETLEAPIRRGRSFTAQDRADQPLVAVVNETLARRVWPGEDPIGKRITMFAPEPLAPQLLPLPDGSTTFPRITVVGVVADIRQAGLDRPPSPSVFVPLAQGVRAGPGDAIQGFHYLVVRTTGAPLSMASTVEAATRESDRNAALYETRTMETRLADSTARRRFAMLLLAAFAALALTLAVVGLYGVMSYAVGQRREELGVRAAIGASALSLLRLVMADGLRMTLAGAGIGLVLAAVLSNFIATQLFEVRGVDVPVYVGVTIVLLMVASVACWIPAIRAARTDPVTALRAD
jgi:putative ABC transport system permease protein